MPQKEMRDPNLELGQFGKLRQDLAGDEMDPLRAWRELDLPLEPWHSVRLWSTLERDIWRRAPNAGRTTSHRVDANRGKKSALNSTSNSTFRRPERVLGEIRS